MKIIHFSRDYTTHDRRFLAKMVETGHEIFYLRLENAGRVRRPPPPPWRDPNPVGGRNRPGRGG
ncbi:MAG: hypothetical protein ACE5GO_06100 [Anaerolineales bacterium]